MNCSECQKKMSDQLDQTLSLHEQRLMKRHLDGCAKCTEELESLQGVRSLLQGIKDEALPESFDGKMKHALFQQNLKQPIGPNVVKASLVGRQAAGSRSWSPREKRKGRWKAVSSLVAVCAVGLGILALSNNLLVPVTVPQPEQSTLMTNMDQNATPAPAMMKLAEPEAATPAQTGTVEPAQTKPTGPAQSRAMDAAQPAAPSTPPAAPPASTKAAVTQPKVQYLDYSYQIEQKLIDYQYEVVNFDSSTGIAKLLITSDKSGTLVNRELEILCQDGRIQIIDNWLGI